MRWGRTRLPWAAAGRGLLLEGAQESFGLALGGRAAPGGREEQRAQGAAAPLLGALVGPEEPLLVGVLESQAAAQHLQEHAAELPRGDVVQQRVHHRAEVEEDVGDGKEGDVGSEVGDGPVLLRFSSCHDPSDLVWHPAKRQSDNDQSCGHREQQRGLHTWGNTHEILSVLHLLVRKWYQFFSVSLDSFFCQ